MAAPRARRGSLITTKSALHSAALFEAYVIPSNVDPPAKEYVSVLWQTTEMAILPEALLHKLCCEAGQAVLIAGPAHVVLPVRLNVGTVASSETKGAV